MNNMVTFNGAPTPLSSAGGASSNNNSNMGENSAGGNSNGTTETTRLLDKRDLVAMFKLIKKCNKKNVEELLMREFNVSEEDLKGIDELNEEPITENGILTTSTAVRDHTESSGATGAEVYVSSYVELRQFVEDALDVFKHELSLVLYPVLVQIYYKLVTMGQWETGRDLVERYGPELRDYYQDELRSLLLVKTPKDIENNDMATAMEVDKFIVRMSRDSHSSLKRHIHDRKLEVIGDIVAKYLVFDTYEGKARNTAQIDATSGSNIGEARRQDNKQRVYYGLLKEIDYQSLANPPAAATVVEENEDNTPEGDGDKMPKKKKPKRDPLFSKKSKSDPNAPAPDRIPLPELKDSDVAEKLKAMREISKRVSLNKDSLPSVCLYTILNSHQTVTCAEISEDSSMLAVGFTNSLIKVWSLTPNKLRQMKSAAELKEIDKDAEDILIRMMDDRSGETSREFHGHSGPVYRCAFAPERNMLLSCSEDSTIRLWSLHTWTCIVVYRGHLWPVWDVRFSPHGYYFASCSYDKTARLWATDVNHPLRVFVGHLSDVDCVQFHPNSNYIASGSSDRTVRLWDVLNGQMVRLMTGHKAPIHSLLFSTCGRYLCSGSADHNVKVWDLQHGQLVTTLNRHSGAIHTMTFSRDGNLLAIGGLDCLLTLWDFSKLTEDYAGQSPSYNQNCVLNDCEEYLLRSYPTKMTPFMTLHFTRRNLLLAVGAFKSS